MRWACLLLAILAARCLASQPAEFGITLPSAAPTIYLLPNGVMQAVELQACTLQAGDNRLLIDSGLLDTDPATVTARLVAPASGVRLESLAIGPAPGQIVIPLQAEQAGPARLRLAYEIKWLQAEIAYSLRLDPATQKLTAQADLLLRHTGRRELRAARLVLPTGQAATIQLRPGETVQQRLFTCPDLPYTLAYLYDFGRFREAVHALLTLPPASAAKAAWPAGKARLYARSEEGQRLLAEAAIPYTPAGEKLELDLGPAPDLAVTRTRLRSEQQNVRTDVYRKLALFDLEEEYELELSNLRATPVTLIVREHFPGDWQLLKQSHPATVVDAETVEWAVPLAPATKAKLTFVVKRLNVEP